MEKTLSKELILQLDAIVLELNKNTEIWNKISTSSLSKDGRDKAKAGEKYAIKLIESSVKVVNDKIVTKPSEDREWYDISIHIDGIKHPFNVKITNKKSADNASSKTGICYSLTGLMPNNLRYDTLFDTINKNWDAENVEKSDYFYIVFDILEENIFWTNLRNINQLTSNGSNPPFQIHWKHNTVRIERSFEDSRRLILESFEKSLELRAEAYVDFKRILGSRVKNDV